MKIELIKRYRGKGIGSIHDVPDKVGKYLIAMDLGKIAVVTRKRRKKNDTGTASGD